MVARTGGGKGRKKKKIVKKVETTVEVVSADEPMVDEAVMWINDKVRNNVHGTYLEIGTFVFEKFFGGNIDQVKSFNPYKESSFKILSEREDLLLSKTNLHNAVQVAIQERLLLSAIQSPERLTYTHRVALLPLKSEKKKEELARKAADQNLSTRELQQLVKKAKEKEPKSSAGRPMLPGFLKSVLKMYRLSTHEDSLDGLTQETLSDLKEDEIASLLEKIKHIHATIGRVEEALGNIVLSKKEEVVENPAIVENETI